MNQEPPQPPGEPPLEPPSGGASHCPQCGHRLMAGASRCSHCGAGLPASPPGSLSTAGMVGLGCLALGFGSIGTCSLLPVVFSLFNPHTFSALAASYILPGAVASYLAILCARRILESIRSRRDRS